MKIQIMSDLHLEFFLDDWDYFVGEIPSDGEILILAGDISVGVFKTKQAISYFCQKFKDVIFVNGNHELYKQERNEFEFEMRALSSSLSNFHYLQNDVLELRGQRFVGTTLWFRNDALNAFYSGSLSDFRLIPDFKNWVYKENEKAINFLSKELRKGDVLITHHLPSPQCVAKEYKNNVLNRFFVCDIENLILERKPKLCVFGHTHSSIDFELEGIRFLSNPFGYYRREVNPNFNKSLVCEFARQK